MYLSPDDAKSDVILAGAALLFGGFALAIVARLPLYPRQGVLAVVLDVLWVVALTGLVPWLLARHRGDGAAAFGLDGQRSGLRAGLPLALTVAVAQLVLVAGIQGLPPTVAISGRLGGLLRSGSDLEGGGLLLVLILGRFAALTLGAVLLTSFLAVRSRHAFPRSPETSLTALLRTFGMGSAALALVVGLLASLGALRAVTVLVNVAAVVLLVLIADRFVPPRTQVTRTAVVAPAVVMLVAHVFAAGGIFGGGLIAGLYTGALGAGVTVVVASLVQIRGVAWAIVPLLLAAHWWTGLLSPLPPTF